MEEVVSYLNEHPKTSITTISEDLNLDRHTVAKYVTQLEAEGTVTHVTKGRAKLYSVTPSSLLTVLKKESRLKEELRSLLDSQTIQDQTFTLLLTPTGEGEGQKCYEHWRGRDTPCPHCPAQQTMKQAQKHSQKLSWNGTSKTVTTTPITNTENETVGIMETIEW